MDVALSDFYLQDLKCQGEVDKKNPDVWIFNVTSLQSCGTKLSVSYVKLLQYFVSSPIIKFNFFFLYLQVYSRQICKRSYRWIIKQLST